ncbi:centrosomal protein of 70 kDa-like [Cololabis saira]|uniref:centrosomal protein of 70 kDa-like n=1 Tax=Cololabis saira TaxID=129043 RepID=UPI002AD34A06|nr:centrosomal protein of 70 kDa-like [Cololabis saira]
MQQQEQLEWDGVNKLLQRRGFKPVLFSDPVENRSLADLVLLDRKSSGDVRATLKLMLTDSERRQTLIQELVTANNLLKEEAQKHLDRAAQQTRRVAELESLLDQVKTRVQDLEDRFLCNTVQLQQDDKDAKRRCESLEQKLSALEDEAAALQRKLYFTVKEEEQRLARQTQSFQNICKRVGRQDSEPDRQVLDVIDFYETRVARLQDQLRTGHPPRLPEGDGPAERVQTTRDRSRGSRGSRGSRKCVLYHQLLTEIHAVVTRPGSPPRPSRLREPGSPDLDLDLEQFRVVLPTLEDWSQQLRLLKDLQVRMRRLLGNLLPSDPLPWQPADGDPADPVKVEDLLLLVDVLLDNTSPDKQTPRTPTRFSLASMVSHFQVLFDVPTPRGVVPRMTQVYTRLGELSTAMRALRDLLDLDSRASPAQVVDQVSSRVSSRVSPRQPAALLADAHIHSIMTKLQQHDQFLPAFQNLVTDILQVLGVSRLDDILPALRALKGPGDPLSR